MLVYTDGLNARAFTFRADVRNYIAEVFDEDPSFSAAIASLYNEADWAP